MAAELLLKKGKRGTAAYLQSACKTNTIFANEVFDLILNSTKDIDDWDTVEWCRWLVAGGRSPEEFGETVRKYDSAATCGLVWIANFVAYRCRTCGISPCMSLCAECFQKGNHEGHDFNMFRSQAGGACDCGDKSVMREFGFCQKHGPKNLVVKPVVPPDLLSVADAFMPRLFLRLIQHLRDNSKPELSDRSATAIQEADNFVSMLHSYSVMGAAMHEVMTRALTNVEVYSELALKVCESSNPETATYFKSSLQNFMDAKNYLDKSLCEIPFKNVPLDHPPWCLDHDLKHSCFLDEIVFWTIKYEFPQKIVCLLLNMMPDLVYKEAFTKTFVHHYHRISKMLARSSDSDTLSNRVVHVSVQLFSNRQLALKMTKEFALLHIMVHSLNELMLGISQQSILQCLEGNTHLVVDCNHRIMKDHCYWFLVSDLNNVLTHEDVAYEFLSDLSLLRTWFSFLSLFQGMNVNQRELKIHVEFESNTYHTAFSTEIEVSATPMWAQISHLKTPETLNITKAVLHECVHALDAWFQAIGFSSETNINPYQFSFHIPLHRYFACFLGQAMRHQKAQLLELLPSEDMLKLMMMHPLQAQVSFNEILCGMWVRSGLQMKGQAMTYIQCRFCNSVVDADLFLLQLCSAHLDPDWFLTTVMQRFHVWEWFSLHPNQRNSFLEMEQVMPMLEGALSFLCTLMVNRTNIGLAEEEVMRQEMVSLLCMSDRTHSQLMDLIPDKCGTTSQNKDFESILNQVADYKAPNFEVSGTMLQGTYVPKPEIWIEEYDPIHILLRAVHRREYQSSLDRYSQFLKQSGKTFGSRSPWPPHRIPKPVYKEFQDPRRVLHSKTMQGMIFIILYRAVYYPDVPEQVLSLCIYLLDMAIRFPYTSEESMEPTPQPTESNDVKDLKFEEWFPSNDVLSNVTTCIKQVMTQEKAEQCMRMVEEMEIEEEEEVEEGEDMDLEGNSDLLYDVQSPIVEEDFHEHMHLNSNFSASNTQQLALPAGPSNAGTLVPVTETSLVVSNPTSLPPPSIPAAIGMDMPLLALPSTALPSTSTEVNMAVVPTPEGPTAIRPRCLKLKHMPGKHRMLLSNSGLPLAAGVTSTFENSQMPFVTNWAVQIDESILSLLIQLHSKLSEKSDSYETMQKRNVPLVLSDSRIGDGVLMIEQIIDRISLSGEDKLQAIYDVCQKLWPKKSETVKPKTSEYLEKEERRKKAKERQQKLMAEFASRQKAFMQKTMETDNDSGDAGKSETSVASEKEYDCVICGQTAASSEDRPMGMVVLLQATSVLGKMSQRSPKKLPCVEEDMFLLNKYENESYASVANSRLDMLTRHFDNKHWQMAVNIGWEGGVHVQSCGHYLHIDCHKSYIQSLKCQNQLSSRLQNLAVDRGEYSCPLCRQLANSVIPLSPFDGDASALVRCPTSNHLRDLALDLGHLMTNSLTEKESSMLKNYMGGIMEDLTNATYPQYRALCTPNNSSLFLFMCSILRTNLEIELVQRGGCLSTLSKKKSCFAPLLQALSLHSRLLCQSFSPSQIWPRLTGLPSPDELSTLVVIDEEIPILLLDCIALLLQIVLTLPLNLDQAYYRCIVQVLYNVLYIQFIAQLSCQYNQYQRAYWKNMVSTKYADDPLRPKMNGDSLKVILKTVIDQLEDSSVFVADDEIDSSKETQLSLEWVESAVKDNCIHFLRIASLLQSHIYEDPPIEVEKEKEYESLCQYLGLSSSTRSSALDCLNWVTLDPLFLIKMWCQDYTNFANKSVIAARTLIDRPVSWNLPSLFCLPRNYDEIFQCYHKKHCSLCHRVPKDPSICLVCGTLVCLREICCRTQMHFEAVMHSVRCGAGTAMYLAVNSSTVIVIRGKRACLWGSVYLDSYGEEDRDLKRGKPLFLSEERYSLLQSQWRNHSFDHTNKRWVWHKDSL